MAAPHSLTPEQRRQRAAIAAHARWKSTPDRQTATAPARQAFLQRFEEDLDPGLAPHVRAALIESARREYFARLAYRSSRARQRKAGAGQ